MPARISRIGFSQVRSRGLAYSDMKMADISPTGTATAMAMAVISSVPANSGIAPKEPDEPT